MGFKDLFKKLSSSSDRKRMTDNQILSFLKLSKERIDELKEIKLKHKCLEIKNSKEFIITEINIDSLVGLNCRPGDKDVKNWFEMLMKLHKQTCYFENDNVQQLKEYLKNMKDDNLPEVIQSINNEIYINGEGKHRLTLSKCLGLDKVKVKLCEAAD